MDIGRMGSHRPEHEEPGQERFPRSNLFMGTLCLATIISKGPPGLSRTFHISRFCCDPSALIDCQDDRHTRTGRLKPGGISRQARDGLDGAPPSSLSVPQP